MIPAYRNNSRPSDGHLPADWATAKRGTIRLALLVAVLGIAVTLAAVAGGG